MVVDKKRETLIKLKEFREIYVLMCASTRAPFVVCNEKTFDDEVYMFYKEEAAKSETEKLRKKMYPVQVLRIDQKSRLGFFISLLSIGVNAIVVNKNRDTEITVQLNELVRRTENTTLDGKEIVENPELQLTALYFMQELRKGTKAEMTEELHALYEEMIAHFQKGRFLLAAKPDKQIPLLKQKDEKVFLPVFTDLQEFVRFSQTKKGEKLTAFVVESAKLSSYVKDGISGVVLNPFGVNVPIQMMVKK